MEYSIQDLIDRLPSAFVPEKAAGVNADIQLHLNGDQPADYYASIHNQKLEVQKGTVENPNITVSANAKDVQDMANGKLDPMRAFMMGKIKMQGDTRLAMQLIGLFRMP